MAYVKLEDKEAVRIKTLTVPEVKVDPKEVEEILAEYKRRYQRTKDEAEQVIAKMVEPFRPPSIDVEATPGYKTIFQARSAGSHDEP